MTLEIADGATCLVVGGTIITAGVAYYQFQNTTLTADYGGQTVQTQTYQDIEAVHNFAK